MIKSQVSVEQLSIIASVLEILFAPQPQELELEMDMGFCTLSIEHVYTSTPDEDSDEEEIVAETQIVLQFPAEMSAAQQDALVTLNFNSVAEFLNWRDAEVARQYAQA